MKILYESNLSVVVPPQFPWIIVISIERRWKRWIFLRDKRRQHTHTYATTTTRARTGTATLGGIRHGQCDGCSSSKQRNCGGRIYREFILKPLSPIYAPNIFLFVFLLIYGVSTHRPQGKSAIL
jgi:hypothetical protein